MKRLLGLFLSLVFLLACADRIPETESFEYEGIKNSTRIGDLLFGGQPSEETCEQLAADGYRTVLSTRGEAELNWDEKAKIESLGMTFVRIPMNKPIAEITDEQIDRFAEWMQKGERPMVLHCGSGDRVAGLWAVWLVEHQKVKPDEALRLAEKAGMHKIRTIVEKRLGATVKVSP